MSRATPDRKLVAIPFCPTLPAVNIQGGGGIGKPLDNYDISICNKEVRVAFAVMPDTWCERDLFKIFFSVPFPAATSYSGTLFVPGHG